MKKRNSFPIYLQWEENIKRMSAEEVKELMLIMMDFFSGKNHEPQPSTEMLQYFVFDKMAHWKKMESNRISDAKKRQSKPSQVAEPRTNAEPSIAESSQTAEAVDVGVPVPPTHLLDSITHTASDPRLGSILKFTDEALKRIDDEGKLKKITLLKSVTQNAVEKGLTYKRKEVINDLLHYSASIKEELEYLKLNKLQNQIYRADDYEKQKQMQEYLQQNPGIYKIELPIRI